MDDIIKKEERILAYEQADIISNDELSQVSGGGVKFTARTTQRITGSYPGRTDAETDQVWD